MREGRPEVPSPRPAGPPDDATWLPAATSTARLLGRDERGETAASYPTSVGLSSGNGESEAPSPGRGER